MTTRATDRSAAARAADELITTAERRPLTYAEAVAADVLLGIAHAALDGSDDANDADAAKEAS